MNSTLEFKATRALVRSILERPYDRAWSSQGLGMLRTYLDEKKVWRLNLWHSSQRVAGVSTIHDHPWDFQSLIVCGLFYNTRYQDVIRSSEYGEAFKYHRIRCGDDGGPAGPVLHASLYRRRDETYMPGETYSQVAEEIHQSNFRDGTVTLNERVRRPDGEHAHVYWKDGDWVDAEPHMATREEIALCTRDALEVMDHGL